MKTLSTVDYDFCKKAKLLPHDLLIWLDLDEGLLDDMHSDFFGRYMMIVNDSIRISCVKKDFDRWANSEEMWFDCTKRSEKNRFIDWVMEQREHYEQE